MGSALGANAWVAAKKNVVTRQKRCPPDGRSRCPLHQAEREVYTTAHLSFQFWCSEKVSWLLCGFQSPTRRTPRKQKRECSLYLAWSYSSLCLHGRALTLLIVGQPRSRRVVTCRDTSRGVTTNITTYEHSSGTEASFRHDMSREMPSISCDQPLTSLLNNRLVRRRYTTGLPLPSNLCQLVNAV